MIAQHFVKFFFFRVSSVLNRDVKQFGKKYLFDGEEETCWNSDQVMYDESKINFLRLDRLQQCFLIATGF